MALITCVQINDTATSTNPVSAKCFKLHAGFVSVLLGVTYEHTLSLKYFLYISGDIFKNISDICKQRFSSELRSLF